MTCQSVNTFPVLATPRRRRAAGRAIILPDHPQIAPESRGALFDGTEIEEALLLHLLALSDGERDELEQHDPALREMLEQAIASAPEDLLGLHGRVTVGDVGAHDRADEEIRGEHELDRRRRHLPPRRPRAPAPAGAATTRTTTCSRAARRRSSGSTSTTTTACTCA